MAKWPNSANNSDYFRQVLAFRPLNRQNILFSFKDSFICYRKAAGTNKSFRRKYKKMKVLNTKIKNCTQSAKINLMAPLCMVYSFSIYT